MSLLSINGDSINRLTQWNQFLVIIYEGQNDIKLFGTWMDINRCTMPTNFVSVHPCENSIQNALHPIT